MAHAYDHATPGENLLIYDLVRNRLPSIADTIPNKTLISSFTWELMNQLEICFKIATANGTIPEDLSRIGHEENYSTLQQSIIANLVAVLLLLSKAEPGTTSGGSSGTFLSKAKAGSVEVEYDQFKDATANSVSIGSASLLGFYKKGAINQAAQLGCIIEICDDCSLVISQTLPAVIPFITFGGCDGCGG